MFTLSLADWLSALFVNERRAFMSALLTFASWRRYLAERHEELSIPMSSSEELGGGEERACRICDAGDDEVLIVQLCACCGSAKWNWAHRDYPVITPTNSRPFARSLCLFYQKSIYRPAIVRVFNPPAPTPLFPFCVPSFV